MEINPREWEEALLSSTYYHTLHTKGLSHDDFWRDFGDYDALSTLSKYPGPLVDRLCDSIPSGMSVLDIGAGTGALSLPLALHGCLVTALDPSPYHLDILRHKAASTACGGIRYVEDVWGASAAATVGPVDYGIAAYSMIDPDLRGFLTAMLDSARRGIYLVHRAGNPDPLDIFVRGECPRVDYRYLTGMLDNIGCGYEVEFFERVFSLPLGMVLRKYREGMRSEDDILGFLEAGGRITTMGGDLAVRCTITDALITVSHGSMEA